MAVRLRFPAGICALIVAALAASTGTGNAVASAGNDLAAGVVHRGFVTVISTRTDRVLASVRVGNVPDQIVVTPDGRTAYVLNSFSSTVTQIRDDGPAVTSRRVKVGGAAFGLAIAPDGKSVYVTHRTFRGGLYTEGFQPVNARTGIPGRAVNLNPTWGDVFGPITVLPDGRKLLIAETGARNTARAGLVPVGIAHNRVGRLVTFGCCLDQPVVILVTPDSKTGVVLSFDPAAPKRPLLTSMDIATGTVRKALRLRDYETFAAMTPDGRLIYLADSADNTVTVVRTASASIVARVHIPFAMALGISPDGKTVYVGSSNPVTGAPQIVTISTARDTVSAPIPLWDRGGVVNAITLTRNGRTAYFAISTASGGYVVPLTTATQTLRAAIPVGPDPTAIAIGRNGTTMYVVDSNNVDSNN